jgi:hypothetical protein
MLSLFHKCTAIFTQSTLPFAMEAKQNIRYWSHQNLQQMHERSLQQKSYSMVWNKCNWCFGACTMTVACEQHMHMLQTFMINEFQHLSVNINTIRYQHYSIYTCAPMNVLKKYFLDVCSHDMETLLDN